MLSLLLEDVKLINWRYFTEKSTLSLPVLFFVFMCKYEDKTISGSTVSSHVTFIFPAIVVTDLHGCH